MRLSRLALLLVFALPFAAHASETPAEHAANVYAQQEKDSHPLHANLPDYSLSPDKLAQAESLASVRIKLHFAGVAWSIIQFILLLWLGIIAWIRDRAMAPAANLRAA